MVYRYVTCPFCGDRERLYEDYGPDHFTSYGGCRAFDSMDESVEAYERLTNNEDPDDIWLDIQERETCVCCEDAPATTEVFGKPSCQECYDDFAASYEGGPTESEDPAQELRRAALNRGRP